MKKKLRKTRNITLFAAISMVVLYTAANCIFGYLGIDHDTLFYFDSTQTSEWFEFWKWVVIMGGTITCVKTAKGSSNSDDDEKSEVAG